MNIEQVNELLYQALEVEIGGQQVYQAAIRCAQNSELREEWQKYLEETQDHERILRDVFQTLSMDPQQQTPGRQIVHAKAQALVDAMEEARAAGNPIAAELSAAESVVEAETKDHQNWELIGHIAQHAEGQMASALKEAYEQVEDQEDEHLYHTMGWARELWLASLGLQAQLPPPEEAKDVRTVLEAARVRQERTSPDADQDWGGGQRQDGGEAYEQLSQEQLAQEARARDIEGRSNMNKEELIAALRQSDAEEA